MKTLYSADLEGYLLKQLMENPAAFDNHQGELHEGLFYFANAKTTFRAISRLKAEQPEQEIDLFLVIEELQAANEFTPEVEAFLSDAISVVSVVGVKVTIERLAEYERLRAIDEASKAAIEQTLEGGLSLDISNQLVERVTNIGATGSQITHHNIRDLIAGIAEKVRDYAVDGSPFMSTGYPELDFKMGLVPGYLLVIAARPSMGKTALALNMLTTIAMSNPNKQALFFSLEMSADDVTKRLISAEGSVSIGVLRGGEASSESDWGKIADTAAKVMDLPMTIIDKPMMTINEIRAETNKAKRNSLKKGGEGISAIMVDYLQIMGGLDGENKIDKISSVTKQLKALGKEYGCPILLLSQLSRGVESRPDKRPINSDLRDSGTIEQDADLIAMIYREEYYKPMIDDGKGNMKPNDKARGKAEIILTKNRNGATGTVLLGFEGKYSRFTNTVPNFDDEPTFGGNHA